MALRACRWSEKRVRGGGPERAGGMCYCYRPSGFLERKQRQTPWRDGRQTRQTIRWKGENRLPRRGSHARVFLQAKNIVRTETLVRTGKGGWTRRRRNRQCTRCLGRTDSSKNA